MRLLMKCGMTKTYTRMLLASREGSRLQRHCASAWMTSVHPCGRTSCKQSGRIHGKLRVAGRKAALQKRNSCISNCLFMVCLLCLFWFNRRNQFVHQQDEIIECSDDCFSVFFASLTDSGVSFLFEDVLLYLISSGRGSILVYRLVPLSAVFRFSEILYMGILFCMMYLADRFICRMSWMCIQAWFILIFLV